MFCSPWNPNYYPSQSDSFLCSSLASPREGTVLNERWDRVFMKSPRSRVQTQHGDASCRNLRGSSRRASGPRDRRADRRGARRPAGLTPEVSRKGQRGRSCRTQDPAHWPRIRPSLLSRGKMKPRGDPTEVLHPEEPVLQLPHLLRAVG